MRNIEKITLSKKGGLDIAKIFAYFTDTLGYRLVPVQGKIDVYWISGKDGHKMFSGSKYYKIRFTEFGFEIGSPGMINSFHMVHWIADDIKAERAKAQ